MIVENGIQNQIGDISPTPEEGAETPTAEAPATEAPVEPMSVEEAATLAPKEDKKAFWIIVAILFILILAAGGYLIYTRYFAPVEEETAGTETEELVDDEEETDEEGEEESEGEEEVPEQWVTEEIRVHALTVGWIFQVSVPASATVSFSNEACDGAPDACGRTIIQYGGQALEFYSIFEGYARPISTYVPVGVNSGIAPVDKTIFRFMYDDTDGTYYYSDKLFRNDVVEPCSEYSAGTCGAAGGYLSNWYEENGETHGQTFNVGVKTETTDPEVLEVFDRIVLSLVYSVEY